ncbi:MAG: hypothetical protein FJZ58_06890 [Chlamydiae bacterium]|nr:hypothetical protein [Chlamydiota bacterium]
MYSWKKPPVISHANQGIATSFLQQEFFYMRVLFMSQKILTTDMIPLERSLAEGRAESAMEIAKKLLKQGVSTVIVQSVTGLSEKEIESLITKA